MISVAIAAYNGEKYIEQQLESILNQTVMADEVLICDDCSSDRTVEICRSFIEKNGLSGWRIELNKKNLGYCRNFYKAIGEVKGDIIFLCDQDDAWDENKLEVMTAVMDKKPELQLLSSGYRLINGEGEHVCGVKVPHYRACFDGSLEPITAEQLIGHSYIRGCSACFRSGLKDKLRPIELSALLGHDWLLSVIAALSGGAAIINTPLMSYRCHDSNVSFSAAPVRRREKRIAGLIQSVEGHSLMLEMATDGELKKSVEKFIAFEKKRIKFLESRNLLLWLQLGFGLKQYRRYYGKRPIRVWLGDLSYALK